MSNDLEINKTQMRDFLAATGIEKAQAKIIKQFMQDNQSQLIILAEYEGKDPATTSLAYVNFKDGYPTTDQVFDSVYGVGKKCDMRIIMFNGKSGYDQNIPTADEWVVKAAIESLNNYKANLILVRTNNDLSDFDILDDSEYGTCRQNPEYFFADIPPAEQFRAEEFWSIYFDSINENFYDPLECFEGGFRLKNDIGHLLYIDPIGEIPVYWSENGVEYVIRKMDDNYGLLEKVLFSAMTEIVDRYGKENISFRYDRCNLELVIKYSMVPFSWMMNATPSEKTTFAEKLHADVFDFRFRLLEIYEDIKEILGEAVNQ